MVAILTSHSSDPSGATIASRCVESSPARTRRGVPVCSAKAARADNSRNEESRNFIMGRLGNGHAAIDTNVLAGDEGSRVARQENNGASQIGRDSPTFCRNQIEILLLLRFRNSFVTFDRDPAGRNRVDCDSMRGKFRGQAAVQAILTALS